MLRRFRPAAQNDLPVIISWIPDATECKRWAGPLVKFPLSPESLRKEIAFSADNSYCLEENGNLAGFGQLLRKSEKRLHAARIIVAPDKRGQGLGRRLCQALIHRTIELKFPRISLNVYNKNQIAINLYQSLGFQEVEKCKDDTLSEDIRYMELDPQNFSQS